LHYIFPSVLRPPHTNPPIRVAGLQKLGFDAEAISLVQLLPGLSHKVTCGFREKVIQFLPRSKAVDYFKKEELVHDWVDEERRGDYNIDEGSKVLEPMMLMLTDAQDYGLHLIYDTTNRTFSRLRTSGHLISCFSYLERLLLNGNYQFRFYCYKIPNTLFGIPIIWNTFIYHQVSLRFH
jgi:hypothetical protein